MLCGSDSGCSDFHGCDFFLDVLSGKSGDCGTSSYIVGHVWVLWCIHCSLNTVGCILE